MTAIPRMRACATLGCRSLCMASQCTKLSTQRINTDILRKKALTDFA